MAKVLSISSQVVYGHVGNSAAAFVLQRMGHGTLSLPTVLLSNRPGYKALAGEPIDPAKLDAILTAIWDNGWLSDVDAILTGYVPTLEHALLCERWISRIKTANPRALYLCDPIIGDEPHGIYIGEDAAHAILRHLVPLADILTPNRFELAWLSGLPVSGFASAIAAARTFAAKTVIVTSAPADADDYLANILVDGSAAHATVSRRETVYAHGTGDFFAANFLGRRLNGFDNKTALQAASAAIANVLDASGSKAELDLTGTQAQWASIDPPLAPVQAIS
jgi:pyridoxine kinase